MQSQIIKFRSRKDLFFSVLVFGIAGFCIWLGLLVMNDPDSDKGDRWGALFGFATMAFLLWIYFGTSYELSKGKLGYKSGPLRGEIEIAQIWEIVKNETLWCGIKPATAGKGLIIKYNKFDEIYISPKTNDSFLKEILRLNPMIKIVEKGIELN